MRDGTDPDTAMPESRPTACYDIVRAPSVVRVTHVHVWAAVAIFEA